MCEFVSWIEKREKGKKDKDKTLVFFLTNKDLTAKRLKEYKEYNNNWLEDIKGHGAIGWFYPELKKCKHKECTSNNVKDYPKEIVDAIKNGELTGIGYNVGLLNDKGKEEYEKIKGTAMEEYKKIEGPAMEEYMKIEGPAWEEYKKIKGPAWEEYMKIEGPAWEEYEKIQGTAMEEYKKACQKVFWKVFKNKSNRLIEWR